jgi:hypothetical protein
MELRHIAKVDAHSTGHAEHDQRESYEKGDSAILVSCRPPFQVHVNPWIALPL